MAAETNEMYSEMKTPFAPESIQTRRAREKLLKKWKEEETMITANAIAEATARIHKWIADHAKDRVAIKEKFGLFNQNKDAAEISSKLRQFAERIKTDMNHFGKALS